MTFAKVILTKNVWINFKYQQFLAGLGGPLLPKLGSDNTLQYIDIISQQFRSRITYVVLLYKTEIIRCPFLYDTLTAFQKKKQSLACFVKSTLRIQTVWHMNYVAKRF